MVKRKIVAAKTESLIMPTAGSEPAATTELTFKQQLRNLIDTAPKMSPVIDYPLEWARIYPEMQIWLAKLAVLAGTATRNQEVILLEAK